MIRLAHHRRSYSSKLSFGPGEGRDPAAQGWRMTPTRLTSAMGLDRQQFLVWRSYRLEWRRKSQTLQENSRIGVTASIPVRKRLSLKFNYSYCHHATCEGNSQDVSVARQYSWLARPN